MMRKRLFGATLLAAGLGLPALVAGAGYDDTWFRADFWSGEYPNGLSVIAPVTVAIRADTDPDLPRDMSCDLPVNATYHMWNTERVAADKLSFVSFTRISLATMTEDYAAELEPLDSGGLVTIPLKKGETYKYLVYYGEGAYLIEYVGTRYIAFADLWDMSDLDETESGYDEWLGLACANGVEGWLLMSDVADTPGLDMARIPRWGVALDLDMPEPQDGE